MTTKEEVKVLARQSNTWRGKIREAAEIRRQRLTWTVEPYYIHFVYGMTASHPRRRPVMAESSGRATNIQP